MKHKNMILGLYALIVPLVCAAQEIAVEVSNPLGFDRRSELAEIPVGRLASELVPLPGQTYIIRDSSGHVLPAQVTHDSLLIFCPGLRAGETARFSVTVGPADEFEPRTFGRAVPERKDDFAWENDRVAFRVYGPALQMADGPSNGIDVWYKRTPELVIDKWYREALTGISSYHNDTGEGLDNYHVGRSLGAGGMAPFYRDSLWLNENYVSCEILDNGPLRTTFRLIYKPINISGTSFDESRTFSIDAGAQFTRVEQRYGFRRPHTVAAGLVRHGKGGTYTATSGRIVYSEPSTKRVSGIWLGMVFPDGIEQVIEHAYTVSGKTGTPKRYMHTLALTTCCPDRAVVYYTGYGWEQSGFPTMESFMRYAECFETALKHPFEIRVMH